MNRKLGLALLLLFAACSKCGKTTTAAGGVERVLPRGAVAVLVVPDVAAVGERLKGLENLKVAAFGAQLNGFQDAHQWADALVQQLVIDVRSKDALEAAGLDPKGGAGVAATLDGSTLLAVAVKDEAKLAAGLKRLAAARFGAGVAEDKGPVHGFTTAAGQPPQLGYAMAGGYALIASRDTVAKLSGWVQLSEADSLAKDAAYQAALGRLPKDRDLVLHLPPGSPALRLPVSSATAALALRPDGLTVTVDAPWNGDPKALAVLVKQAGPALTGHLPADAWLVARFGGDPSLLGPWIGKLVPQLPRAFEEAGVDGNAEVLGNLKPGAVAGLSLAPTAKMDGMPEMDVRSTNPFNYAHLTGAAQVKDAGKVSATLEKLTQVAPKLGSQMAKTEREGKPVYVTTYAAGEGVHLAAAGDTVFFGSPVARIDALLKTDGKAAGPIANPKLAAVLDANAFGAVVDLRKLAGAVRELPSSAWGIGGFAIKATTLRWLDATDDLEAITVTLDAKEGVVQAQLVLSLKPAPPPAAAEPKVP